MAKNWTSISLLDDDPFGDDIKSTAIDDMLVNMSRSSGLSEMDGRRYRMIITLLNMYITFIIFIKLSLCLCTTSASLLLIYVVRCFPRVRAIPAHTYFVHYAIANLLYFFLLPMYDVVNNGVLQMDNVHATYCVTYQIEAMSIMLMFCFAAALLTHWLCSVQNFRNLCLRRILPSVLLNHPVGLIYSLVTLKCVLSLGFCLTRSIANHVHLLNIALRILYAVVIVYVGAVNCVRMYCRRKFQITDDCCQQALLLYENCDYFLVAGNFIAVSWLPMFLYHFLYELPLDVESQFIVELLVYLPEFIAYTGPIVVVYMLGRYNKHFQMAYDNIFQKGIKNNGTNVEEQCYDHDNNHQEGYIYRVQPEQLSASQSDTTV